MRAILTSLMAFFLSLLAGMISAQWLAVATNAAEEFILVFASVPLLAIVFGVVFLLPQIIAGTRSSIDRVGKWSLAVLVVLAAVLLGLELWAVAGDMAKFKADLPIIGLVLPGVAILVVDWLFVRWRIGAPRVEFGRNGKVL
ncbi:hypothetical protein RB623_27005 [Mesorhizobium sp. LHD-90]|uniref:hypothetical protein n=1 Tax=Mesorhizobium sp. LHD-90 TaxID=3071414 RepID=UPI0027E0D0B6|nr:hypothetical protein [Mesorhizobium sp. LHD-90]MDQ6437717.1 hypothetical protein [Mesorhizobium sp. LHD-90]